MFDDPVISKLIIFALLGLVAVLGIAVIVLAVKKNTYYVNDNGSEIKAMTKEEALREAQRLDAAAAAPVSNPAPSMPVPPTDVPMHNIQADTMENTVMPKADSIPQDGTLEVPMAVRPAHVAGLDITVIVNGNAKKVSITSFPCLIGRESTSCGLVIPEPAVSRRHASFLTESGVLYIEDVSEHNGTFVNGVKLPPLGKAKLHSGDRVNLGRAEILIDRIY